MGMPPGCWYATIAMLALAIIAAAIPIRPARRHRPEAEEPRRSTAG